MDVSQVCAGCGMPDPLECLCRHPSAVSTVGCKVDISVDYDYRHSEDVWYGVADFTISERGVLRVNDMDGNTVASYADGRWTRVIARPSGCRDE